MSTNPHLDRQFELEIRYIGLLNNHGNPYNFTHDKNTIPYYSNTSFESLLKRPNALRYFTYYLTRYNDINYSIVPMAFVLNFEVFMLFYHYGLVRNIEDFRLDMFVTGQKFIDDPMLYYTLLGLGFPLGEFLYERILNSLYSFDKSSEQYQIVKNIIINYIIEHAGDNVHLLDNYIYQLFDRKRHDIINDLVQKGIKVNPKYIVVKNTKLNPFAKIKVISKTENGRASEDRYLKFDVVDIDDQTLAKVYCVFDGHSEVSTYHNLPENHTVSILMDIFRDYFNENPSSINLEDVDRVRDWITQIFIDVDRLLYDRKAVGGSTCSLIMITPKHIYQVNLGDSRSIIIKDQKLISETVDHDPNLERERIESVGGSVSYYGTYRVNNVLATSRSFGDLTLKRIYHQDGTIQIYSPDAPVSTIPDVIGLPRSKDMEIIIGSDGLFDGFNSSSELLVQEINQLHQLKVNQQSLVDMLIAYARRRTNDDITCTSIYL